MPTQFSWIVDQRILYVRSFAEDMSLEEFRAGNEEAARYIAGGQAPVHMLLHTNALRLPISLGALQSALEAARSPQLGWTLQFGSPYGPVSELVSNALGHAFRLKYRNVKSLDEAFAILARQDHTLPPRAEWQLPQCVVAFGGDWRACDTCRLTASAPQPESTPAVPG
ncbi:MAG: hypothetical protein HC915_07715 [Anaerolineae bacterium]|nr:hypothetical protein [Anaerolineae bacterium]